MVSAELSKRIEDAYILSMDGRGIVPSGFFFRRCRSDHEYAARASNPENI
jgi:hypothetical protein